VTADVVEASSGNRLHLAGSATCGAG